MNFIALHAHSHFSILDGLSQPKQMAERCAELEMPACAITDHGSISGAADFMTQCKKKNIKSILGCEFYVTELDATLKDKDNFVSHQVILAKNFKGWQKLIQLVSASNDKDRFYYKPRIDLNMMREICDDNLISFSGHLGSTLHLRMIDLGIARNYIEIMKDIFGKENFFIEVQSIDSHNSSEAKRVMDVMRHLASTTNTQCVATCDAHYPSQNRVHDHQVLLCSALKTTLKKAQSGQSGLDCFFNSQQFHIPSTQEMIDCGSTNEEICNTELIANMCEDYDITGPPRLPKFPDCGDLSENEYLKKLCVQGWYNRKKDYWNVPEYQERIRKELGVIEGAGLAGYFLIVQDYVNWGKNQGWLIGPGRGSGAGCLISYLLGITSIDPIKHGLIFERFYNAGRNTKDRVSLPDIDVDFPVKKRKYVIEYLKNKYGHDRVCQMATFGRMMGRGALKEVLRVHNACSYEEMNTITKNLPQEAEISDQLEASEETSIIRWVLQHDPKRISDWCTMDEGGGLHGDYANFFAQAIRLEGTYKSQGKHAAGVVLSSEVLDQVCPMINDKNSDEKIAGMAMNDLEAMGHVKFDILGVNLLDKLMGVNNLLQFGKVEI
jgi:DNA polymerase-3 subunit alpha